ncbi:opacity protein-like surface antigen [Neorhizobium huautlense]|uniref:Opacity protein-like surface antigen n=1 Tax=Neorhizobium huautlense TaxID=67774 RepID=A0ABT9PWH9_9HYPH|nr:outer membrane protein [Neorhizobium huautlense]MDP9838846.1 opacity protein-like surface antigen [Neorhizobium huautlense]
MKKILSGAVALLLATTAAHAADLYQPQQPIPLDAAPEVEIQQSSGGWYLRGDVGYSFNKLRGARFYQGGSAGNEVDFTSASIGDSALLGGGIGYQFNDHLRGDLTFDHMTKSSFKGSTTGTCGAAPGYPCNSDDRSSFRAYSLMANLYVDLGTYAYFTPYVGAGFGASYVKWSKLRNTIVDCVDPTDPGCEYTEHSGKGKWRATAALMAGTSIDITCNLKADVGYRFRYIDGGNMFGFANAGGPGRDKGIYSHEARVGARYMFNNNCSEPASYEPEPAPIVYK